MRPEATEGRVEVPATAEEARQRNYGKLQDMIGGLLGDSPRNSTIFKAFEFYTERGLAEQPLRTTDQETMTRHVVRQEVLREAIRQWTAEDTANETALESVSNTMRDFHHWTAVQPIPAVDKAMNPNWDSHYYKPRWLDDVRKEEVNRRKTLAEGRQKFEEFLAPTKINTVEQIAYTDYTNLQSAALELIKTGRTLNWRDTSYDEISKKIARRQRADNRYDQAYATVTTTANEWRPAVTHRISDDYEAQSKFVDALMDIKNQNTRRISQHNRAPINPPLNPKI
jgi:hypothetical protein